ncbi:MAG: SDR family oxidoreductase [Ignavibacteriales bacterium]|nr:SDR family oxidoreductase [Ignavibacteriales bacterium]
MKNVLVTGGTGFLGSNLAAALLEGGCNVRILRRAGSDTAALGPLPVEHCIGDVRDVDSLRRAAKGCDTVFHTAALISYWRKERLLMYEVNIQGTRNVAQVCIENGIQRLVHTSSTAAVGFPEDGALADETICFNWEPYDVGYRNSKHRAEGEIQRAVSHGLDAVIVNPTVIIGPGDMHFHGGQLLRDVWRKRIFYYVQGGMSVAYVSDVVRGHLLAARQGRAGERYILSGENLSHREIISTTADVVGGIQPLFRLPQSLVSLVTAASESVAGVLNRRPWVSRELLAGSNLNYHFSCRKAQKELGYTFTPFREAVERTFEWYIDRGLL